MKAIRYPFDLNLLRVKRGQKYRVKKTKRSKWSAWVTPRRQITIPFPGELVQVLDIKQER